MAHLVIRLIRWLTGRARIEGATRSDLVDLTSADRRAHPGVSASAYDGFLEQAVRGAIYDGLKAGHTIEQTSEHLAKLWPGEIDREVIDQSLRDELKRLTRVPTIVISPRNTGKRAATKAMVEHAKAEGHMVEIMVLDDVAPILEPGAYARIEAQRTALARSFPEFATGFLKRSVRIGENAGIDATTGALTAWIPEPEEVEAVDEPLEGVKSSPAKRTEPTGQVWGPSPIRRAFPWWRLLQREGGGRVKKNWRVVVPVPVADVQDESKDEATLDICRAWASDIGVEVPAGTDIKILCDEEDGNIVSYPLTAPEEVAGSPSSDEITDPEGKAPVLDDDAPESPPE